jgi:predicted dehydrogenase
VDPVLLIGFGYSGKRFYRVLSDLAREAPDRVWLAGVCDVDPRRLREVPATVPTFDSLDGALEHTRPTTAVVAVNEYRHYEVLKRCAEAGLTRILCEKPLAASQDEARELCALLADTSVTVNLVERHSPVVDDYLRWAADVPGLAPTRVEFFWGKHRVGDARPTIGVLSELIHGLDLVNYLFRPPSYDVVSAHGLASDFSSARGEVVDTLDLVLRTPSFVVAGHCSFAWPARRRVITALLSCDRGRTYRATLEFDSPHWDLDTLEVVEIDPRTGRLEKVLETRTASDDFPADLTGVYKLSRFVRTSLSPAHRAALVDVEEASRLQEMLDAVGRALAGRISAHPVFPGEWNVPTPAAVAQ